MGVGFLEGRELVPFYTHLVGRHGPTQAAPAQGSGGFWLVAREYNGTFALPSAAAQNTSSPYYVPLKTLLGHLPFFCRSLTLCRTMRLTGGAALQPVSGVDGAHSSPSLPATPAARQPSSRARLGGHTLKAGRRRMDVSVSVPPPLLF